eukprot:sb/3466149/
MTMILTLLSNLFLCTVNSPNDQFNVYIVIVKPDSILFKVEPVNPVFPQKIFFVSRRNFRKSARPFTTNTKSILRSRFIMTPPPPVLIVATILEGKQFPPKPKSQLLVTCKFAGETLNSDAVLHTNAPYFNTELAWEMTKKNLHQHRLQRTPLKLTFTCVTGSTREEVGHVMLDLRSIAAENEEYKWYPLARSKYKTHKPQIRLLLAIEEESAQPPADPPAGPPKLFVSLDPSSGCYQVGDPTPSDSVYGLSLTVIAAAHLSHLINNSIPGAFCFRFNLLDNVITNSSFSNAVKPDFPLERVSVKLRGTLPSIYRYLSTVKDVSLQLCQGKELRMEMKKFLYFSLILPKSQPNT